MIFITKLLSSRVARPHSGMGSDHARSSWSAYKRAQVGEPHPQMEKGIILETRVASCLSLQDGQAKRDQIWTPKAL